MQLTINGQPQEVPDGMTVGRLLLHLDLKRAHVAVERNGEIVPREEHEDAQLAEGDRLEIVTLVGGG